MLLSCRWDRQPYVSTFGDAPDGKPTAHMLPRNISRNFLVANYGGSNGAIDNDDESLRYENNHNFQVSHQSPATSHHITAHHQYTNSTVVSAVKRDRRDVWCLLAGLSSWQEAPTQQLGSSSSLLSVCSWSADLWASEVQDGCDSILW